MRTTVELPRELLRAAKAKSAERGESLKALLTRAVEAEIGSRSSGSSPRTRVTFPMFGDPNGPKSMLSIENMNSILDDEDVERYFQAFPDLAPASSKAKQR